MGELVDQGAVEPFDLCRWWGEPADPVGGSAAVGCGGRAAPVDDERHSVGPEAGHGRFFGVRPGRIVRGDGLSGPESDDGPFRTVAMRAGSQAADRWPRRTSFSERDGAGGGSWCCWRAAQGG
jgi:hypothetical protein